MKVPRSLQESECGRVGRKAEERGGRLGPLACSLVEVGPVVRTLDVDSPHTLDPLSLPLLVLIQVMGAPGCSTCGLQERIVRSPAILGLIQQNIQGLLINTGFRELNLCPHKTQGKHVSMGHTQPTTLATT